MNTFSVYGPSAVKMTISKGRRYIFAGPKTDVLSLTEN